MNILENEVLAPYTTFKIGGPARFFCVASSWREVDEARAFAEGKKLPMLVLGGGSNMLISDKGFDGLVVKIESKGVEILFENESSVLVSVGAGENWDNFVAFTVNNGWWGVENLSHIPGNTGAIAVQNVGAYGQEASEVINNLLVYDTRQSPQNMENMQMTPHECTFGYRSSIFNTSEKGRYVILNITFLLKKNGNPNVSYRDLQKRFEGQHPSLLEVRKAVIEIRNKKFPFPTEAVNGNAGSFFKNTIVSSSEYEHIRKSIAENFGHNAAALLDEKRFEQTDGTYKIPSAFLLDICGVKTMELGGAAINAHQPLVIINKTGTATASDVVELAKMIQAAVKEKTGVALQIEPELIGF